MGLKVNDPIVYRFATENNKYELPGRVVRIEPPDVWVAFDAQPAYPWKMTIDELEIDGQKQVKKKAAEDFQSGCFVAIQALIIAVAIEVATIVRLFLRPFESALDAAPNVLGLVLFLGISWRFAHKATRAERGM